MREERKQEHIENYLKSDYEGDNLFSCVYLEHNALPEISFDEISLAHHLFQKPVGFPILINAMTGGTELTGDINEDLARLAREFQLPIAVGSQTIALEDEGARESFRVVREIVGREGIVIGNLSANRSWEEALQAVEMIEADALELHLNPLQELVMEEGDRDFRGLLENIGKIVKTCPVPVIVKEVGSGISSTVALRLMEQGVAWIDVAGHGGTNFVEIEDLRRFDMDFSDLYTWGIPTAKALLEIRREAPKLGLIASGGIRDAQTIVKALVLGADMVAMSGELLSYLMHGGYEHARNYLHALTTKTAILMTVLGAGNIEELRRVPVKLTGRLRELLD